MTRSEEGARRGRHSVESRRERLAAELRANLSKRKAQARARGARRPAPGRGEPGEGERGKG